MVAFGELPRNTPANAFSTTQVFPTLVLTMDRFAFMQTLAPHAGASEGVPAPIFQGACCFLDEGGHVLFFLPSPQNGDSTQLSCVLTSPQADRHACTITAEFDAAYRLELCPGMVSHVEVVEARTNRPPALRVTLSAVAVTMQLWSESETCGATALESMETLAKAFADLIMPGCRGDRLQRMHAGGGESHATAGGAHGAVGKESMCTKRPEIEGGRADDEPPPKCQRVSLQAKTGDNGAGNDEKGECDAVDVLTSSCDKFNGMCCRARRSQEQVVDLCLGIKTIVKRLLQQAASDDAAASQAAGIRPALVPTAQVDAHLTTLAKTVSALHHHGSEASESSGPARLALTQADRLLLLKTVGPGAAGAGGCSSAVRGGNCSEERAGEQQAKVSRGGGLGGREYFGDGHKACALGAESTFAQHVSGNVDDVLRVSRSLQIANVDLAMLSCWGT